MRPGIALQPLGQLNVAFLPRLALDLAAVFSEPCRLLVAKPLPRQALDLRREQYVATLLLDFLRRTRSVGPGRVLAIAEVDLYADGLNFVFGQAEMPGRVAVISLHRLLPGSAADAEILYRRTLVEAVHELGHTYGLAHCLQPRCVMRFSNSLADTDLKSATFCPDCRTGLARAW